MKKIILLDRDGDMLEYITNQTSYHIVVLVCELHPKIEILIEQYSSRITHILDYNQLPSLQHITNIDYSVIAKMKHIQIDVETMLHRIMYNNPIGKDIYHQYLSFFTEIFRQHQIAFVLCAEAILASPNHLIPFGFTKLLGIPSYDLGGYFYNILALGNYNTNTSIPYSTDKKPQVEIQQILFYKKQTQQTGLQETFKRKIKKIISKIGGEMMSEFFVCLSQRNFTRSRLGIPYSYFSKLQSFLYFKKMYRYYNANSIIPDFSTKYIYYSIHMEPEAAIIGRTILEAQLTIIKMLASALPQGWKLYVKEHPHQFMLNNETSSYFINHIEFFKNIEFYKEIQKLENVKMISLKVSSKELLENSEAVATMGGTITLESMVSKKPAILFNAQPSVYGILNNVLSITSYQDLQEAIQKIQDGFADQINPEAGFEILQKYLSNTQDPNFYPNLFSTIEEHAKTIKPTGESL